MLGGCISNDEEEEVEDELAALEAELSVPRDEALPDAPDTPLEATERVAQANLAKARELNRQAMLA